MLWHQSVSRYLLLLLELTHLLFKTSLLSCWIRNHELKAKLLVLGSLPYVNLTSNNPEREIDNSRQNNYNNQNQRGRGGGCGNRGGRGNNNWANRSKSQCQICTKFGHTASKCFFRYAPSWNNLPQSGFYPSKFPQSSNNSSVSQMSAMVASPDLNVDSNWYPDSGAMNHLTNNFNNLSTRSENGEGSQIYVANGSCLPILHYGSASLSSLNNNRSLVLQNLLHVPSITKNLISVSQFARDNSVFFEFHPIFCYVKDPG